MTLQEKKAELDEQTEEYTKSYNQTVQQISVLQNQQNELAKEIIGLRRAVQEIESLIPASKEK